MHEQEWRSRLVSETGEIGWPELQRHFARGVVIHLSPRLDLVEVARALEQDDGPAVAAWMDAGQLARATDLLARQWDAALPRLRAIVVAPWVLVQEILDA